MGVAPPESLVAVGSGSHRISNLGPGTDIPMGLHTLNTNPNTKDKEKVLLVWEETLWKVVCSLHS